MMFFIAEAMLGYVIQTSPYPLSSEYSYTAVLLACAFCLIFMERSSSYLFTQLALVATVLADYYLVHIKERDQLMGMIFFSITQIMYFLRLYFEEESKRKRAVHLAIRCVLSVCTPIAAMLVLGNNSDAVAVVSIFYYVNLALNLVVAFTHFKRQIPLALGFLCFILCDTVIGFANIGPYLQIPEGAFIYDLLNPGFDPAWAFYVPSQALLSISLLPKKLNEKRV